MGQVLGYNIQFGATRAIVFGSLSDTHVEEFREYSPCDVVFLPLAGRNDVTALAFNVAAALHPKLIIPTHYDSFFPPISQFTDLTKFEAKIAAEMLGTQVIKPEIGVSLTVDI
jgi:L-ascorbate metabolism protein UlaG (beta-lactamase superfamily)